MEKGVAAVEATAAFFVDLREGGAWGESGKRKRKEKAGSERGRRFRGGPRGRVGRGRVL